MIQSRPIAPTNDVSHLWSVVCDMTAACFSSQSPFQFPCGLRRNMLAHHTAHCRASPSYSSFTHPSPLYVSRPLTGWQLDGPTASHNVGRPACVQIDKLILLMPTDRFCF